MSGLLDVEEMPCDEIADTTLQPDYDSTSKTKCCHCYHSDKIMVLSRGTCDGWAEPYKANRPESM